MAKELILVVDDEGGIRESLADILTDEGYDVITAASGEEGVDLLKENTPALVFLDVWLPGIDGLETLVKMKEISPELTVIMISGHGTIETAVKATTAGAYDFIEKPLSLERIVLAASHALEQSTLKQKNIELRRTLTKKYALIGESPQMKGIRDQIKIAAGASSRVMITGESGTGKEIVAHLLHEYSPRAQKPFIEVNCAAIPTELIESELFGHEKGSFTGAFESRKGKFELANNGTLFLDEIGDMSFETQAKLLRVLEGQQFQRIGGSKSISVDTRVIAATNQDLSALIEDGKFREDLFFRLNVIPIAMPPLRERKLDMELLVDHFLTLLAEEYRQPKRMFSKAALQKLIAHPWPGNIRELKNLTERLVIMSPKGEIGTEGITTATSSKVSDEMEISSLKAARAAFERNYIEKKLQENDWNVSRTAEAIEIERSNLHRKIKSYGIVLQ